MEFREITPIPLYESVIEQIMDLIRNRELKPGDKLPPERDLAEKSSIFELLEAREIFKLSVNTTRN